MVMEVGGGLSVIIGKRFFKRRKDPSGSFLFGITVRKEETGLPAFSEISKNLNLPVSKYNFPENRQPICSTDYKFILCAI